MAPYLSKYRKIGVALAMLSELRRDRRAARKKRSCWSKKWLLDREKFSHVRLLEELDADDFKNFLRMDEKSFRELVELVRPHIQKQGSLMREAVSVEQRLVVTLRYLATGRNYEDLKFGSAISPQLLGRIIPETCQAIVTSLRDYIKVPKTQEEWRSIAQQFEEKWNFNHCVGSIDGKHVAIQKPPESGSSFFNYKHFFSIVLFGVVNADYEFIYVNAGTNGAAADSTIFKETTLYKKLVEGQLNLPKDSPLPGEKTPVPYVFIGDSAFGLNKHLMKPFPFKNITYDRRIFNCRFSRARRVVENVFGILANRFRVLRTTISLTNLANIQSVVLACCYLHNFLIKKNPRYITNSSVDSEDVHNEVIRPGSWREGEEMIPISRTTLKQRSAEGIRVRYIFTNYFNSVGQVSFQDRMVNVE